MAAEDALNGVGLLGGVGDEFLHLLVGQAFWHVDLEHEDGVVLRRRRLRLVRRRWPFVRHAEGPEGAEEVDGDGCVVGPALCLREGFEEFEIREGRGPRERAGVRE